MENKKFTEEEAKQVAAQIGLDFDKVDYDLAQFTAGMNIELEHGLIDSQTNVTNDDPIMTGKIAWAHLKEISDYYDRLEEMEEEAEK